MDISFKQALKAQAHHLKPIILLGAKGLTDSIIEETLLALKAHELIKVKINGEEKADKKNIMNELCQKVSAQLIQIIGNTAIIYRKNKQKEAKKPPSKKPIHRSKSKRLNKDVSLPRHPNAKRGIF